MRTPTNDTPMQPPKQSPEEQLFIQPTMQQLETNFYSPSKQENEEED